MSCHWLCVYIYICVYLCVLGVFFFFCYPKSGVPLGRGALLFYTGLASCDYSS